MPYSRISLLDGKPPSYVRALCDSLHAAMVEAFEVPERDRFQIVHRLDREDFIVDAEYLSSGAPRSDDFVHIAITTGKRRSSQVKAAFYGRLAARLRESPGIRPEDVMVVIADSTADDWSLAGGAQWRPGEGIPRKGDETPFDRSVPRLAELTRDILFGDVWERPQLAPRDRSLVTLAVLVALGRVEQLPFHLKRAVENGVSRDELGELVTHVAFYAGWPAAASAATRLDDFLAAGRDL